MKFRDLLENGFISDNDVVRLRVEIGAGSKQYVGNWYQDGILNCVDLEVDNMSCNREWGTANRVWEIELKSECDAEKEMRAQKLLAEACVKALPSTNNLLSAAITSTVQTDCASMEGETC